MLLAAATAGGKTEAVFLPVCSVLARDADHGEATGIQAVCLSPLKASSTARPGQAPARARLECQVIQRMASLGRDIVADDPAAIVERHLAADEDQVAGPHRLGAGRGAVMVLGEVRSSFTGRRSFC